MDQNIDQQTSFKKMRGFFKIWAVDPITGKKELLVDKENMILNAGADLLASALAGVKYTHVSHMYIGYKNHADDTFYPGSVPTVDKEYTVKFTDYNTGSYTDFGYLRVPLSYSPSFIAQTDYENNVAIFTAVVTTASAANGSTATFKDDTQVNPSHIFEVALVAATEPTSQTGDKVFSRAQFEPLLYNNSYNLTITWGVQFLA